MTAATIDSDLPAAQQPSWPDRAALDETVASLATYPPLVFAGECDDLRDRMAAASVGEAFARYVADVKSGAFPAAQHTY